MGSSTSSGTSIPQSPCNLRACAIGIRPLPIAQCTPYVIHKYQTNYCLLRDFFPVILTFLRQLPFVGQLLNLPYIRDVSLLPYTLRISAQH